MPYSTQTDLSNLLDNINITSEWVLSPLTFYGTGLNDLSFSSTQPETNTTETLSCVVRVTAINVGDPATDQFEFSDDDGATWYSGVHGTLSTSSWLGRGGISIEFGSTTGHTVGDYWKFTATPSAVTAILAMAYDWVNDNLERYHPIIPIPSPSQTVVLAEATYAIYLFLRANNDARSAAFHQEAERLITLLTTFKPVAEVPEEAGAEIREEREAYRIRREEQRAALRAKGVRLG